MTTEYLMNIGFIFKDVEKGRRIVGGADLKYSTTDLSWLDFINENILVKTKSGDFIFKVKKIDVFSSISGALNIGLTLYDDLQFDFLSVGDVVYKILK